MSPRSDQDFLQRSAQAVGLLSRSQRFSLVLNWNLGLLFDRGQVCYSRWWTSSFKIPVLRKRRFLSYPCQPFLLQWMQLCVVVSAYGLVLRVVRRPFELRTVVFHVSDRVTLKANFIRLIRHGPLFRVFRMVSSSRFVRMFVLTLAVAVFPTHAIGVWILLLCELLQVINHLRIRWSWRRIGRFRRWVLQQAVVCRVLRRRTIA